MHERIVIGPGPPRNVFGDDYRNTELPSQADGRNSVRICEMRVDQVKRKTLTQAARNEPRRPIIGSRLKRVERVPGTYKHSRVKYFDLVA